MNERAKLLRTDSSVLDRVKKWLTVKLRGSKATYTAEDYSPHGTDSRAPKGMTAIYIKTERDGDECVIGYLVKDRVAEVGEHRIFSTDENNQVKFNVWLRNDGTILMGDSINPAAYTNFAVKYNELKAENDKLKATVDSLVSRWNTFCASYVPGSPTTVGLPATLSTQTVTPNTSNFNLIKNEKIKTN